MLRFLLLVLFLVMTNQSVWGQDPGYTQLDKSKGLPSNAVYDLLEDSRGFIWMATDAGLCRYDGYSFKLYTNPQQSSRSGTEITEDRFGRIWYENFDGFLFYVENDSLKSLDQKDVVGYTPFGIGANTIFVCNKRGTIDLYDLHTLRVKKKVPYAVEELIYTQKSGDYFYVNQKGGMVAIDEDGNSKNIFTSENSPGKMDKLINCENGPVWLYNRYRGTCLVPSANGYVTLFEKPEYLIQAASNSRGMVWFCTTTGTFAYDSLMHPFENGRLFLHNKSISSVICDRENNYWFSTTNEGVFFVNDLSSKNYLPELNIRRLAVNENELYAGTLQNKIYKIKPEENIENMVFDGKSSHSIDVLEFGDSYFRQFFVSDSLHIYTKTDPITFNAGYKDFEFISPGVFAFAASGLCGIFYDDEAPYSPWKDFKWRKTPEISFVKNTNSVIENIRGKSICYDSEFNVIYFATNAGLFKTTTDRYEEIKTNDKSIYISKLTFYNGLVYALTTKDSLITIDRNGMINSFPCENLNGIQGIKRSGNWLFVYNFNEVVCFNLDQPQARPWRIKTYSSDIYDIELYGKQLMIACNSGLLAIDFLSPQNKNSHPLFYLNSIQANGIFLTAEKLNQLSSDQNNIAIEYSILSFKTGSRYPLYYRINEGEWELCPDKSRILQFNALAPGDYTISFRLGEADEDYPVSKLNFSILRPLWYRSWAIAIYIVFGLTGIFLLYNYQIKKREKVILAEKERVELENKLNRSVLTSIKSQMNPHFFYNALNTIQSFIYTNEKQNAGNYLSKFSKLTRMILEMSEQEEISLQEEITALRLYLELEQARFENDFQFEISIQPGINNELTRLPSMLIQPYVENAVKHGLLHKKGHKILNISFEIGNDSLKVIIDDNGIGRMRSAELNAIRKDKPKSFATDANIKRLELLNQGRKKQLSVKYTDKYSAEGKAEGTTVVIHIPLKNEKHV